VKLGDRLTMTKDGHSRRVRLETVGPRLVAVVTSDRLRLHIPRDTWKYAGTHKTWRGYSVDAMDVRRIDATWPSTVVRRQPVQPVVDEGHQALVRNAHAAAMVALRSAVSTGRRQDCLRAAVDALRGALRNIEWEDSNG
jgi:hypothetical protein